MLTDIFAFRYAGKEIWESFGNREKRLLVQAFSIVKEMAPSYYDYQGKESAAGKAYWKNLHDRIAVELGLQNLSPTAFGYQQTWQGKVSSYTHSYTWLAVCENWIFQLPAHSEIADEFVKERLSLIEVAFRDTEEKVAKYAEELPQKIFEAKSRPQAGLRIPGDPIERLKSGVQNSNANFRRKVEELNTRFRQAGANLHYHNGFIQISEDDLFLSEAEAPFWALVGDVRWKNVDIDMKEAIDRRDNGDRDPVWYAARALESTIKIISEEKGWTHGGEKGAHNYLDNLAKKGAGYIETWEKDALKAIFTEIRNPFGHGPGSAEMPSLSRQQTDLAIEMCISWIKSLIKRL